MPCDKIMLIRHCERPDKAKKIRGVAPDGRRDKESLTPRGWQRAGALVSLFAPLDERPLRQGLARPATLHACKASPEDPSLRPQMTLIPLVERLGSELDCGFFHGEEDALVRRVLAGEGPALIAWKHDGMNLIANAILGDEATAPQAWPYERYDVVWIFDRDGERWRFSQAPQLLLAGDSAAPIA